MVVYTIEIILTGIMLLKKEGLQMDLIPDKTMFRIIKQLKAGIHLVLINRQTENLTVVIIMLLNEIIQIKTIINLVVQHLEAITLELAETLLVEPHQKVTNLTEEIINIF